MGLECARLDVLSLHCDHTPRCGVVRVLDVHRPGTATIITSFVLAQLFKYFLSHQDLMRPCIDFI